MNINRTLVNMLLSSHPEMYHDTTNSIEIKSMPDDFIGATKHFLRTVTRHLSHTVASTSFLVAVKETGMYTKAAYEEWLERADNLKVYAAHIKEFRLAAHLKYKCSNPMANQRQWRQRN